MIEKVSEPLLAEAAQRADEPEIPITLKEYSSRFIGLSARGRSG